MPPARTPRRERPARPHPAAHAVPATPAAPAPRAWSLALAVALLAAYAVLLLRVTADEDAAELTLALVTNGVAHPPGYALWTLAGHGVVALARALGAGYAIAANLWAALGGATAAYFLHRLALRLVPPGTPRTVAFACAAAPVVVFALSPAWLAESTIVEVHSWHVAWLAATTLLFADTLATLGRAPARATAPARMAAWGLACGLGAAHHTTSVFYSAAYTAALAWALARAGRLSVRAVAPWLAALVPPLASLAWLHARAAHPGAASVWPPLEPTWQGVWAHVTGQAYRAFVGRWNPDPLQAAALAHEIYPLLWPALLLAAATAFAARGAARTLRIAMFAGCVVQLAFTYRYGVPDPVAYFLPPLALVLLPVAGPAAAAAMRLRGHAVAPAAAIVVATVVVLLGAWGVRAQLERRRELERYDAMIRSMWHAVPFDRAMLLWPADPYAKLLLYQRLEHDRTGVEVVNPLLLMDDRPRRAFQRAHGFDPLANNGPEHAGDTIAPRYLAGRHALVDPRFLGRLHQTIADSARVPVVLFDDAQPALRRIDRR